jgi:hypothetical protein
MSWLQWTSNKTHFTPQICILLYRFRIQKSKMAAILAGMPTGLWAIGVTIAASDKIVDEQGYDSLTALAELTDQTCPNLLALIRKPGGTIPDPDLLAAGSPLQVQNPGIKVGHWQHL